MLWIWKKNEDAENIIAYQYRKITSIIFVNEIFGKPDDEISQKSTYVFCAVDELSNTMVPKMWPTQWDIKTDGEVREGQREISKKAGSEKSKKQN